jgi:hypothetical protein
MTFRLCVWEASRAWSSLDEAGCPIFSPSVAGRKKAGRAVAFLPNEAALSYVGVTRSLRRRMSYGSRTDDVGKK